MDIEVKYHEGASKLGSDIHGVMCDLAASETVELKQGEVKVIPLGVSMKLPDGYFGFVVPRSSTCLKHGIMMANSVGIIESDYCGNNDVWGFVAYAIRDTTIEKGTRIAQFMPVSCFDWGNVSFKELDTMPYPNRGGYGSTGTKASDSDRFVIDKNGNEVKCGDKVVCGLKREKRVLNIALPGERLRLKNGDFVFYGEDRSRVSYCEGGWDFAYHIELRKAPIEPSCLDADGVPIKVGDVVYLCKDSCDYDAGVKLTVKSITSHGTFRCKEDSYAHDSDWFSHRKPDSWEQLVSDVVELDPQDYVIDVLGSDFVSTTWEENQKKMEADVIRRFKRLAGVEND